MKPRYAAALALVVWYLALPTVAGCTESDSGNKWPLMMPPIRETGHGPETDLGTPLNQWWVARKYPSRETCERARANWPSDEATRKQVLNAKCVYRDDLVFWCLGIVEGKAVPKNCANCAFTLELKGHGCVENFKTEGQCTLGADKYVQDYYVSTDKTGELVVVPPVAKCAEIKPPGI